ncbi:MAG: HEPN domain-containing protein [Candidatus Thorarchaeota archaeon]
MTNIDMAQGYLKRARSRLVDAPAALKRKDYPEAIRYSQECVEISTKSVLRLFGIEYPGSHEVSDLILHNREMFPDWFETEIDRVRIISRQLSGVTGLAMYGDESSGTPPDELFTQADASRAVEQARIVFDLASRLLEEFRTKVES